MIEVAEQLKDYATCIVGSEELEPGDGWEYHEWLGRMSDDPPADADRWARQAVEAFGAGYAERPTSIPARSRHSGASNQITDRFAELVQALDARGDDGFAWVLTARSRAQSFTSDKDSSDLKDFALRLAKAAAGEASDPNRRRGRGRRDRRGGRPLGGPGADRVARERPRLLVPSHGRQPQDRHRDLCPPRLRPENGLEPLPGGQVHGLVSRTGL